MNSLPTAADITNAANRIQSHIHRTPVLFSSSINQQLGAKVYFKCENMQKVGAFKYRGATNALLLLSDEEKRKGVATHSSGNHAAALSCTALKQNIKSYIVMPRTAPEIKKRAVKRYGGVITFCEPTLEAREKTLEQVVLETGATFIHPYNNYRIIAGQATACIELLEDMGDLDIIISPVGGGGLLSGTALSAAYFSKHTKVIGAEPSGADDACRSLHEGRILPSINPDTICDGLKTSLGELTFPIISRFIERILTADDDMIITAMIMIWERLKIVIEPSSAVALAVLLKHQDEVKGKRIGVILSGGNVDLSNLPWMKG